MISEKELNKLTKTKLQKLAKEQYNLDLDMSLLKRDMVTNIMVAHVKPAPTPAPVVEEPKAVATYAMWPVHFENNQTSYRVVIYGENSVVKEERMFQSQEMAELFIDKNSKL